MSEESRAEAFRAEKVAQWRNTLMRERLMAGSPAARAALLANFEALKPFTWDPPEPETKVVANSSGR